MYRMACVSTNKNNIVFESRCRVRYIIHCPYTLIRFLEEELEGHPSSVSEPEEMVDEDNVLVDAISDMLLRWLMRSNKTITIKQVNTFMSRTHICQVNSIPSNEVIKQFSLGILEATASDSSPYTINNEVPEGANPYMEIFCLPTFYRQDCSTFLSTLCAKYTLDQRDTCSISPLTHIMSWMIRSDTRFVVQTPITVGQEGPLFRFVPDTIFPFIDMFEKEVLSIIQEHDNQITSPGGSPTTKPNNSSSPSSSTRKTTTNTSLFHPYSTRKRTRLISQLIQSASRSKIKIQYNKLGYDSTEKRHMPGEPPKLLPLQNVYLAPMQPLAPQIKEKQLNLLSGLLDFRQHLLDKNIISPRDNWERWMDDYLHNQSNSDDISQQPDRAFMCLIIIIMSSSTSDAQLSKIIPRLFSIGLTSATACYDIASRYGMNAFCSIISDAGRYYNNAERIVNSADYFIQRHDGTIPSNICARQFEQLIGIGHKTVMIVLSSAFSRDEGIPCDIHVFRWCFHLEWTHGYKMESDSLRCSHLLTSWIPRNIWKQINPLFGSLGQLLQSNETRPTVLSALDSYNDTHSGNNLKTLIPMMANIYQRS